MLVFNKEGKLQRQYVADALKTATDFVIDEDARHAYFIADDGVMGLEMGHFTSSK